MTATSESPSDHNSLIPGRKSRGYWVEAARELGRDPMAVLGSVIVVVLLLCALLAPLIAPHAPNRQIMEALTDYGDPLPPGSPGYMLGSDGLGRDVLARVLYGARASMAVGVSANLLAAVLGILMGGLAGLSGYRTASVLMRLADVIVSFPVLLLAMAVLTVVGNPGILAISVVIGVNFSGFIARIVYSQVNTLRQREFIVAAEACGAKTPYILLRHILPHVLPSVVVFAALGISTAIQLEAALSYVGLGIRPPTSSWGNMIADGQPFLFSAPWLVLVPGSVIFLGVVGFSLLGDGLRDALDPTLAKRGAGAATGFR